MGLIKPAMWKKGLRVCLGGTGRAGPVGPWGARIPLPGGGTGGLEGAVMNS